MQVVAEMDLISALLVIVITQKYYLILAKNLNYYLQSNLASWYHHFAIMKSQNEQLHMYIV